MWTGTRAGTSSSEDEDKDGLSMLSLLSVNEQIGM